ncbi:MAG: hypothetical protein H0T46_34610 [Deltaproteobacteria bacterium]|nr:hypothetical protein [Deltaproteobacteria bacterium]
MSTFYTREVVCPRCQRGMDAWLARGIHASRRTDLRDEILARSFQHVHCDNCSAHLEVEQQLVYTDFERRHWIYVCTEATRADWAAWEQRLSADIARFLGEHSPLVAGLRDGLRTRIVFGYEELREKLVVWDAGVEDALAECLKVRAYADDPSLVLAGSSLVIDRIDGDDTVTLNWFAADAVMPSRQLTAPSAWLRDTDRDRASLAQRFPELFAGGYVNVRRYRASEVSPRSSIRSGADRT